jgi:predicted dehydrogenase
MEKPVAANNSDAETILQVARAAFPRHPEIVRTLHAQLEAKALLVVQTVHTASRKDGKHSKQYFFREGMPSYFESNQH